MQAMKTTYETFGSVIAQNSGRRKLIKKVCYEKQKLKIYCYEKVELSIIKSMLIQDGIVFLVKICFLKNRFFLIETLPLQKRPKLYQ